jgi:DNA-directed RNA polymerase specialized sigma subunit
MGIYLTATSPNFNSLYCTSRYLDEKEDDDDPLTQAFKLNKKVQDRAEGEQELKKEYLKLSEQCKTFATDLYNGCRSMKEITALLNIDEKQFDLSYGKKVNKESRAGVVEKLRIAIKSDHKEVGGWLGVGL